MFHQRHPIRTWNVYKWKRGGKRGDRLYRDVYILCFKFCLYFSSACLPVSVSPRDNLSPSQLVCLHAEDGKSPFTSSFLSSPALKVKVRKHLFLPLFLCNKVLKGSTECVRGSLYVCLIVLLLIHNRRAGATLHLGRVCLNSTAVVFLSSSVTSRATRTGFYAESLSKQSLKHLITLIMPTSTGEEGNQLLECSGGRKSSKHVVLHDTGWTPPAQLLHQLLEKQHHVHCSLLSQVSHISIFMAEPKENSGDSYERFIGLSSFEWRQTLEASAKFHYCDDELFACLFKSTPHYSKLEENYWL